MTSYADARKQMIELINETEKKMIELYKEHVKRLLTNTERKVTCINVHTDHIETIRSRQGQLYEGEDFEMRQEFTFVVKDGDQNADGEFTDMTIVVELVWSNFTDRSSHNPRGRTTITILREGHVTLGPDYEGGEDWFLPENADDKEMFEKFFSELHRSFAVDIESVFKCVQTIIDNASELSW